MGRKKCSPSLHILLAKKDVYFRRVEALVKLIDLFPAEEARKEFLELSATVDESRQKFETIIDEINILSEDYADFSDLERFSNTLKILAQEVKHDNHHKETNDYRLPDLQLFDGDLRYWPLFWQTFNRVIHSNPTLPPEKKIRLEGP